MVSLRSSNYRTGSEASSAPTHVFHATATTACLVILQMPSRYALLLCLPILLARPCLCYRLFDSRGALVRSVIEGCRSKTPNERAQCYPMLRCILNDIPSEVTARWNAGSSIMAFIPTIVGLLSNSIEETTSIADESILLAIALSMSSVTAFTRRFGDRPKRFSDIVFDVQSESHARIQTAVSIVEDLIAQSRAKSPWWKSNKMQLYSCSIVALFVGAGVWYEVYQITRYGIVVFACAVKANVAMWIGLTQLLTVFNVLCRSMMFDTRIIHIKTVGARPRPRRVQNDRSSTVVLRSRCDTFLRWLLQTFTAIASFTLYAYGTIILASTTLIPASDAIRALVMSAISASVGRLAAYWFTSPQRRGSHTIVVDVPADCLQELTASISACNRVVG